MRPEDMPQDVSDPTPDDDSRARQLDALLTQRRTRLDRGDRAAPATLAPLLDAADALAPLADARPSDAFAAQLEARLMARAEARVATEPLTRAAPPLRLATASARGAARRGPPHALHGAPARATWAAVAAAVVLAMTVGALTASAHPGAPFYPLRRVVEGLSAALSDAPATSARASLQRANSDLASFTTAATQGDNAGALTALSQLTRDDQQAASFIAQVSDSSARASLQNQLDSFHSQEISRLRAALPLLDWPVRIQVTSALRGLGSVTLTVTAADIGGGFTGSGDLSGQESRGVESAAQPVDQIRVVVTGAGFTTGAVLLINGQQVGVVDSITATTVIAHLSPGGADGHITSVGVGEPDGTAANTTTINPDDHGSDGTPEAGVYGTPDPNSTPSHPSGGTPTPQGSPTATRTPDH